MTRRHGPAVALGSSILLLVLRAIEGRRALGRRGPF